MNVGHSSNTSRPRSKLAVAVAALAAVSTVAFGAASPASAESAEAQMPQVPLQCGLVFFEGTPYYECEIHHSGFVPTSALPGDTENLPIVITASGTPGADGDPASRTGGDGGKARTVVDGSDLGDEFYVYSGRGDRPRRLSHRGGAATAMTKKPIERVTDVDDVFVIAGGGGAQGIWRNSTCGGGSGGSGGIADAATSSVNVTGSGDRPQGGGDCSGFRGQRPYAGHNGIGGVQPGNPSTNGHDGIGGVGGGTHWKDSHGHTVSGNYTPGAGGRSTAWASGGGGYGGGGAGERNWGGAGGGSFATAATAEPPSWEVVSEPLQRSQHHPVLTLTYPWTL